MLIGTTPPVLPSEITPRSLFDARRTWLRTIGQAALLGAGGFGFDALAQAPAAGKPVFRGAAADEPLTPLADVIGKTRFRELEEDMVANSAQFRTRPWTVAVEGEVLKPQVFDIDALARLAPHEERIYRMRCTEGWSLVIPYNGYPLAEILRRVQPTGNAKYVEFTSIHDPANLRGQREVTYISWPYVEGLRLDEAMHPLTLVAFGIYGEPLSKPNGAPLAIRVPWKYGIKSPKAVVKIRVVERQPVTVWQKHYPQHHSFWSNVNPEVSASIWRSQAHERRVGELARRPTLMFNGYASQVAQLYAGMDPKSMY